MILSHKYKFIFIKTGKTGGTSLEMALSQFLGPEDVISPLSWTDEKARYRHGFPTAQNFEKPLCSLRFTEIPRVFHSKIVPCFAKEEKALRAKKKFPKLFWDHMPACDIKEIVGSDIWNNYFKFSVERNPWDKVISKYFWDPQNKRQNLSFREFILSGEALKSNFERYTINGMLAIDRLIRYDQLYQKLEDISHILDLPENVGETLQGMTAKSGYRPDRNITEFYDEETRNIVDIFFAREIRLLNFKFGEL